MLLAELNEIGIEFPDIGKLELDEEVILAGDAVHLLDMGIRQNARGEVFLGAALDKQERGEALSNRVIICLYGELLYGALAQQALDPLVDRARPDSGRFRDVL